MGSFLLRLLPLWFVQWRYVDAGSAFGDAVSHLAYRGECVGFDEMRKTWGFWEREYARRGYRTLPLKVFVEHGGFGGPLTGLGEKRTEAEEPILYA